MIGEFIELDLEKGGSVAVRKMHIAAVLEKTEGARLMMVSGQFIDVTQSYDEIGNPSEWFCQ